MKHLINSWLSTRRVESVGASLVREHRQAKLNKRQTLISIIYNYYMKESTVFRSLESIRKQALTRCLPSDIEIIIIDDGSEGEDVSKRLPASVTYYWQRKVGYGICRAKNAGAMLANGRYLIFLDPDITVCSKYIDAVIDGFEAYGDNIIQCGYVWDYHFVGCPDPRTEFGVWENPDQLTRRFYQIAGGNMAIARQVFMRTPGFDEDLIYGGVEDLLFGYNYSKLSGASVYFNRKMGSWHIPHPPSLASAAPSKSWAIVKHKYPEFYDEYITKGLR